MVHTLLFCFRFPAVSFAKKACWKRLPQEDGPAPSVFGRRIAAFGGDATKSAVWGVYKFIHVNTVAPFETFRTKIRKWEKAELLK